MDKGTILFHRDFQFHNGQAGEKLIIVLNTPKDKEPYMESNYGGSTSIDLVQKEILTLYLKLPPCWQ